MMILDFLSTSDINIEKKLMVVFVLNLCIIFGGCSANSSNNQIVDNQSQESITLESVSETERSINIDEYYNINKEEDGTYSIIFYDANKERIIEDIALKEPYVYIIENRFIRITTSVGNPLNYTYFYDVLTSNLSPVYENIYCIYDTKVAYFSEGLLIVRNFIDKEIYYKEIRREWSATAVPSSAIIKVEFIKEDVIEIQYFEGSEHKEIKEVIDLNDM